MTEEKLSRIKVKIRKLFALSKSPNQHESEAALAKAHKLMNDYNISMLDVGNEIDPKGGDIGYIDLGIYARIHDWQKSLGFIVSQAFDVQYFIQKGFKYKYWVTTDDGSKEQKTNRRNAQFGFYGISHGVEMAVYTFDILRVQVQNLAKKYKPSKTRYEDQVYFTDYAIYCVRARQEYMQGVLVGLRTRLNTEKAVAEAIHPKQSAALVILTDEIAEQTLKSHDVKISGGSYHSSQAYGTGSGASMQGIHDSKHIRMNKGINDGK